MKRLILVDGNSLMYRAYYGLGDPTKMRPNSKGIYTNAINAFARMINHLLKDEPYDNVLVAFDAGKHTFRHNIQPDYKAGRAHMPDEMRMQIAYLKDFLTRSNIAQFEIAEYEADDIVGTLAKMAENEGYHVDVYSSDRDLLQLISDNTTVHMTIKGMSELEDYTPAHFEEVYNIKASQFIDLKALMGDKSDNISGVPGIGPKKGEKLLQQYGSVEGILENVENIKGADKQKFIDNHDLVLQCKKMVTILRDAPLGIDLSYTEKKEPDLDKLKELYEYLELNGLLKELASNEAKNEVYNTDYKIIDNPIDLKNILLPKSSLIFETFESNYHKANILCIGIKNQSGTYIIKPELLDMSIDLQLFLSDKENLKAVFDYKKAYSLLKKNNIELNGIDFDLLLATYVINPSNASHEFKSIASSFDYYDVLFDEQVYGKGSKRAIPLDLNIVYQNVSKKVTCLYLIKNKVKEIVKNQEVDNLLYNVEIPLAKVLANMEYEGVSIDLEELENQKADLKKRIDFIESEIYRLTGEEFNIQSPKQLGEVLFEHLNLPFGKKTKTGYSTSQEVLDKLRNAHPSIEYILAYRQLTKLYQTYIEGLRPQIYPDGRVHTIYEQALTETGRLSSIEPNLQNIPTRSEEGKNIRKMFKPNYEGYEFLSCDYSQVELRVLAHVANVTKLINSFNNGEDIHARTAAEIFNVDINEVSDDLRRKAKAVNFGIIYGLSAFGLAQEIGMSNKEAQNFIDMYYKLYPEIKTYMDDTIKFCQENGYVKTILNRRRYIPDINSNNYMLREFGKRTAMNAPIQGSAADIIKMAMVKISKILEDKKMKSKMVLQIHDELIFEVCPLEKEELEKIVVDTMENIISLKVKLKVSKDFGHTWYEV